MIRAFFAKLFACRTRRLDPFYHTIVMWESTCYPDLNGVYCVTSLALEGDLYILNELEGDGIYVAPRKEIRILSVDEFKLWFRSQK